MTRGPITTALAGENRDSCSELARHGLIAASFSRLHSGPRDGSGSRDREGEDIAAVRCMKGGTRFRG